jgi:hypothetical protein
MCLTYLTLYAHTTTPLTQTDTKVDTTKNTKNTTSEENDSHTIEASDLDNDAVGTGTDTKDVNTSINVKETEPETEPIDS